MEIFCTVCSSKIGKIFGKSKTVASDAINMLNKLGRQSDNICTNCAFQIFSTQLNEYNDKIQKLNEKIKLLVNNFYDELTVASSACPSDCEIKGIVTGYSALGTGLLTEFTSTFTDAFGVQSGAYHEKLRESEDAAKRDLIFKALNVGATAVYDTKFQITEATSGKGILIVYFFGTAVVEKDKYAKFSELLKCIEKQVELEGEIKLITIAKASI